MSQPSVAIQLIVFAERNRADFPGVLRDVKEAGFPAIEAGNLFASVGEAEARRLLDANGLTVCGAHFGYGDYADTSKLTANIAFCKAMGIRHLMCSGVADTKSVEGYRTSCRVFDEVGKRLAAEGMRFNYHNHAWEFEDLGGVNGMQILAEETDPALVGFNIDVFWVTIGGEDPAGFIRKHAARAGYFHFKDGRRKENGDLEFLELGRGVVDLVGAMEAALEVGAEWIVAEQDRTALPHLQSATISRTYLRDKLGV
ncbi:MAG TPA: sugar phosphate isomerase/epimerase [Chthonomonadales bacterium]|nr:sugar phosphate isomerase/epimerase [Chthonomonadales bacterium]